MNVLSLLCESEKIRSSPSWEIRLVQYYKRWREDCSRMVPVSAQLLGVQKTAMQK